jgi:hypothetical protein
MRELALVGFVALAFGLGSYQIVGEVGVFNGANLALGIGALLAAGVLALGRAGRVQEPALRAPLIESALTIVAVFWGAILLLQFLNLLDLRFDWTFEGRYETSPAMLGALDSLETPALATLYTVSGDPRLRPTRMLLEEFGRHAQLEVRSRALEQFPEDEDRFGIGSSNSVVIEYGGDWRLVERPSEGTLYEAISQLTRSRERILYVTVGAGEGDLEKSDDLGYTGFRAALETEGYELRPLPTAAISEVPRDADGLIVISPERRLTDEALKAISNYLEDGGRLVAFTDPGRESGIEDLLAEYGLASADAIVIDPASGPIDGDAPGLNPLVFNYSEHPVTQGLSRNRQTFFRRARAFQLYKPEPEDRLKAVVHASGESWLHSDLDGLQAFETPERPADAIVDYHALVATGVYDRDGQETRIVAFGDSDVASNRYLRALYNLDLVTNAVHWALEREADITIRPKATRIIQFPVPIQNSLSALYGIGLVVPELLLLCGGLIWLRRRAA